MAHNVTFLATSHNRAGFPDFFACNFRCFFFENLIIFGKCLQIEKTGSAVQRKVSTWKVIWWPTKSEKFNSFLYQLFGNIPVENAYFSEIVYIYKKKSRIKNAMINVSESD